MTGVSLPVLLIFLLLVLPVCFIKLGYDRKFPLKAHQFSMPIEIQKFYLPVFSWGLLFFLVSGWCGLTPQWSVFDHALFPAANPSEAPRAADLVNWQTVSFLAVFYLSTWGTGMGLGLWDRKRVTDAINGSGNFLLNPTVKLVGLWGALLNVKGQSKISVDVLAVGDILYSGTLFHYEFTGDQLTSLALKDAKRFLVPLSEVQGKDENNYPIPGRITYFNGSQIKNVNIRNIEEEKDGTLILAENFLGFKIEELEELMEAAVKETGVKDRPN